MQMVDQYISDLTYILSKVRVSLVAQLVKNHLQCGRPGFDPWVGKIPPPEKGKATHSSILAWRTPMGSQRVGRD